MATATTDDAVNRLRDSKPPATDAATYLTIIEMSLTPQLLPELRDILDDVELTSEIGWDLVEMLIAVPGSEPCLERVAHLGNPREVILKVLEVMEKITVGSEEDEQGEFDGKDSQGNSRKDQVPPTQQFVTLCGMLAVLHDRLRVKAPSRFLHTTLDTVYRSYDAASPDATAAVIALVRSLSGQKRPPLPTRKSSTVISRTSSFQPGDASRSAPDPEGGQVAAGSGGQDAGEPALVQRLLQVFVTCVLEAFVNANALEWSTRLLEFTYPERIVLGRMTQMQAFKDVDELQARDSLIGQLVALASDVGLSKLSSDAIKEAFTTSHLCTDPLSGELDSENPEAMGLATGGLATLVAYWMFATDLFDAQHSIPDLHIFPHHHAVLGRFLDGSSPQEQIASNPGVLEAILVLGIWLHTQSRLLAPAAAPDQRDYMAYHHLLTLVAVFHANPRVRQSAITLAGHALHAFPEDARLGILEDVLESCMFSSLQSCAVSWTKDEILAARKTPDSRSKFATAEGLERLQYALFPDLTYLEEQDTAALLEFWAQAWPFQLQVANFLVFALGDAQRDMAPAGMAAAVEHRYVEPLLHMAGVLRAAPAEELDEATDGRALRTLTILTDTLARVKLR
ncbi:putative protein family, YAP/Alf4/glomulin [Cordyceps fumosorosea ARSEF 2679]|uniref:Yap-binding protein n=1 Tax=Cordyceps fumosorosea (strain ARSEF 2679) TaxID=1081104 RepID=A0A167LR95_CORFA|nr:putative protein family, YAP/Alf4/glomulin [Cordyceps fumosorosea ARSEF 2679]OAA53403.1 putative protein family, YAP/Alf4/glomulin [Cordyceps fumosorosea ARSEF 2679]